METQTLENIGLSRAEIKVYISLIEMGATTTGPLSEKSKIPTSNIYSILGNLILKGLVSYKITSNKRYYRAEDPNRIYGLFEQQKSKFLQKEIKLKNLISDIEKIHPLKEQEQEIFIYEGINGIKSALEFVLKVLKEGDLFLVIDASKISNELLMGYFNDFHRRRAKQKINYKIVYGFEQKKYAQQRKKYSFSEVKILPKGIDIPSVFWIFNEYVVIAVFSEKPIALMIKNNKVSDSFKIYFDLMWNLSIY